MVDYAAAYITTRSIAWLVEYDNWEQLENIIKYNCVIKGGIYNAIVPLTKDGTLTSEYQQFLRDYDADIVVIPDKDLSEETNEFLFSLNSFGVVKWQNLNYVVSIDPSLIGVVFGKNLV
jgi:hypothetical protein